MNTMNKTSNYVNRKVRFWISYDNETGQPVVAHTSRDIANNLRLALQDDGRSYSYPRSATITVPVRK